METWILYRPVAFSINLQVHVFECENGNHLCSSSFPSINACILSDAMLNYLSLGLEWGKSLFKKRGKKCILMPLVHCIRETVLRIKKLLLYIQLNRIGETKTDTKS